MCSCVLKYAVFTQSKAFICRALSQFLATAMGAALAEFPPWRNSCDFIDSNALLEDIVIKASDFKKKSGSGISVFQSHPRTSVVR
uniref:Uncharacterized protein n=1 Tax=Nomascus leucogenys TaxID=61853 RepID=A0A2I3HL18_NOMLE